MPEVWRLIELLAEGVHALSHSLGLIAADVHALRQAFDRHEGTLAAWERGGKLGALAHMKYARRHGGDSNDHPPGTGTGRPDRP